MVKASSLASVAAVIILQVMFIINTAAAVTVPSDVSALQELYKNLNYPPQLVGWKSDGGDPCGESWTGISCDAASVINITLPGLGLRGYIAGQLNLPNLKELVLSFNEIQGEITDLLPPDIAYIDLSSNKFHSDIPQSLAILKHLRHLNLSHNMLSGIIGNYFSDLQNLNRMDLSYNNFSGDLPSSFANLTSLTVLFLQNNQFTGSVSPLANLPLTDLNIQNNNFSGVVPRHFQRVPNLWILGNEFQNGADLPPIINSLPVIPLSAPADSQRQRRPIPVGTLHVLLGGTVLLICAAGATAIQNTWSVVYNTQVLILPSAETGSKKKKRVYLQLKTAIPIFLTLFSIQFTLSQSCNLKVLYLVFMGFCWPFFIWMGFEAFEEFKEMDSEENSDNAGNWPLIESVTNQNEGRKITRLCRCSSKIRFATVAISFCLFSVLCTVFLSVSVFTKTC